MLGLVFTLALSFTPSMPSASVTCAGWPASCDGAWGAIAGDTAPAAPADAANTDAADDGPRDYATPAEVDCPTPPDVPAQAPATSSECSEPPPNLWYRVSRFPDSERPSDSLIPAPRRAGNGRGITSGGARDIGHWSTPNLQPLALFALPGLVPDGSRDLTSVSTWAIPTRALAPPDRPPRA